MAGKFNQFSLGTGEGTPTDRFTGLTGPETIRNSRYALGVKTPEQWGLPTRLTQGLQVPTVSPYKTKTSGGGDLGMQSFMADQKAAGIEQPWSGITPGADFAGSDLDIGGKWLKPAEFGLSAVGVGLDIYNAFEQSKMNDFMKDYYGDMMDIQRADFGNAAKSANYELSERSRRIASAQGMLPGTAESDAYIAKDMDRWGATETV